MAIPADPLGLCTTAPLSSPELPIGCVRKGTVIKGRSGNVSHTITAKYCSPNEGISDLNLGTDPTFVPLTPVTFVQKASASLCMRKSGIVLCHSPPRRGLPRCSIHFRSQWYAPHPLSCQMGTFQPRSYGFAPAQPWRDCGCTG